MGNLHLVNCGKRQYTWRFWTFTTAVIIVLGMLDEDEIERSSDARKQKYHMWLYYSSFLSFLTISIYQVINYIRIPIAFKISLHTCKTRSSVSNFRILKFSPLDLRMRLGVSGRRCMGVGFGGCGRGCEWGRECEWVYGCEYLVVGVGEWVSLYGWFDMFRFFCWNMNSSHAATHTPRREFENS
jgi:hypothetical protein